MLDGADRPGHSFLPSLLYPRVEGLDASYPRGSIGPSVLLTLKNPSFCSFYISWRPDEVAVSQCSIRCLKACVIPPLSPLPASHFPVETNPLHIQPWRLIRQNKSFDFSSFLLFNFFTRSCYSPSVIHLQFPPTVPQLLHQYTSPYLPVHQASCSTTPRSLPSRPWLASV